MPTSLTGIAAKLERLPADIVEAATKRFDEIATASAGRVVGHGGTMMMHTGRGRRATKLGTKPSGSGETVVIHAVPGGAWRWIEDGTRGHRIGSRKRFLKGAGFPHPVRGPVRHPGSRGARAWSRAVDEFRGEFPDVAITELRKVTGGR